MARKKVSSKLRDVGGPPDDQAWAWHSIELLRSDAWRERSINCVRLLDFLEIENMQHGGTENGDLFATYDQLVIWRIPRRLIHSTIEEAERLKLVEVQWGVRGAAAKNNPTRFRLTYLAARATDEAGKPYYTEPTDEWRRYKRMIVPEEELNQCHIGNRISATSGTKAAKEWPKTAGALVPEVALHSISGIRVGGGEAVGANGVGRKPMKPELRERLHRELRGLISRTLRQQGRGAAGALASALNISPEHLSNFLGGRTGLSPIALAALVQRANDLQAAQGTPGLWKFESLLPKPASGRRNRPP